MDEINDLHQAQMEWGCITNLMDKISDLEEKIDGGWEELIDMVVDAVQEEMDNKSAPENIFFNLYQFFFRLYYRLKANPEKRPFNKVTKTTANGEEAFMIQNYDYTTYKWAKTLGCGDRVSNDYIYVPTIKLNDKQRRHFERKVKGGIKNG